jgi:DNA-binding transcriptional ArsR family regulator
VVVTDPAQAQALLDTLNQDMLAELLEGEQPASVLAARLDVAMNTLHYRLRKLERLGLVRVARVQTRAGRAVRWYAPTARLWDIPFDLTPAATVREFVAQTTSVWLERTLGNIAARIQEGLSVSFGKWDVQRARLEYNLAPADEASLGDAVLLAQTLRLAPTRAAALRTGLETLITPFLREHDPDGVEYTISVLFQPSARPP